jgi:hypothetical protein
MGVAWSQESPFAVEAAKWEMDYSMYGPPGRPRAQIGYQEYPKTLSLAGRNGQGVPRIIETVVVESAQQQANYESRGYRAGQDKALEALHAKDFEVAELAANRAFLEKRMSPAARAEAAEADESTSAHLPAIPETPLKPRKRAGRPRKVTHDTP